MTGKPAPAVGYRWQSSVDGLSGWMNLPAATAVTYRLKPADSWRYLRSVVTATNAVSPPAVRASAATTVVIGVVPSPPRTATASPRNRSAVITWLAPAKNGGAPITHYTVTSSPGRRTCTTAGARTCTVTGLTNKGVYRFTVTATNVRGTGPASAASAPITVGTPTAPRGVAASFPQATTVRITWTAPAFLGSGKITSYQIRWSLDGGRSWTSWASTGLVNKTTRAALTKGHKYQTQVRAVNGSGFGLSASLTFTPTT